MYSHKECLACVVNSIFNNSSIKHDSELSKAASFIKSSVKTYYCGLKVSNLVLCLWFNLLHLHPCLLGSSHNAFFLYLNQVVLVRALELCSGPLRIIKLSHGYVLEETFWIPNLMYPLTHITLHHVILFLCITFVIF